MQKFGEKLLIAGLLLILMSCNDSLTERELHDITVSAPVFKKTKQEALDIANAFAAASSQDSRGENRKASSVDNILTLSTSLSRGAADTLMYVVNYDDNQGYALVSVPLQAEDVIAYVENGSFDDKTLERNPAMEYYLELASSYIVNSANSGSFPIDPGPIRPRPYSFATIAEPKINLNWGQEYPEGFLCPNERSGCVQTAMAMIMSYFEEPKSMTLTYSDRDMNNINIDWASLKVHKQSSSLDRNSVIDHIHSCDASLEAHQMIGRICRQLGELNYAQYEVGWFSDEGYREPKTGATSDCALDTYKKLLPNRTIEVVTSFSKNDHSSLIRLMKTKNAVAQFYGPHYHQTASSYASGSHSWVCEGGREYEIYTALDLADGTPEPIKRPIYFYFNWGYNGENNGYFLSTPLDSYNTSDVLDESDLPRITGGLFSGRSTPLSYTIVQIIY